MSIFVTLASRRVHRLAFAFLIGLALFTASSAKADTKRFIRHRVRTARIALQPFSQHQFPSSRLHPSLGVAYYAPHAIPRASSVIAEESNDEEPVREVGPIQSSGSRPVVSGNRAVLRNGVAYAPSNAPERVKSAIWAVNTIRRKPYIWGGGHGSFNDRGYDCSGTVSFALHNAGLLSSPLPSSDLMRFGQSGRGRWITVYARHGHTFATIAGLRLDTTDFRYGSDVGPRWHTDFRDNRGFVANHPSGL
ncbi:MAG: hypothetical protein ABJB69_08540 [Spartobacteria bacterium]